MTTLKLAIQGMSCSHCLNAVNKSLAGLDGVQVRSVGIGRAELEYDPEKLGPEQIMAAVADAGYPATAY